MSPPVAIIGAGPVGITTALLLAGDGVSSTLIDKGDGRPCVGSRSIAVARWTLETFERLGCGRRMADEGVTWTLGRTYLGETELFQTKLPDSSAERFPPFVNLGQERVEEILLDRVAAEELIDTRWNTEIASLDELGAEWIIGCDGQHSTVRELARIRFPGHSHDDKFLVVDVRADLPFPLERRFFFEHPANGGRQVLIHPQPASVWRIDWQVPRDFDLEVERESGRLAERIRAVIGDVPYEICWQSSYVFHQRLAERFRAGNVLLAGDAAHVFAPFGGRGMNSGIDDAANLAWKLALVVNGEAPEALLDTYEDERRAAAQHNLDVTDATMRFLVPPSAPRRWLRDRLLHASVRFPSLRRHVNSGKLSAPFGYAESPICADGGGAPAPAACLANRGPGFAVVENGRGFLLVRPDGHVATTLETDDPDVIAAAVRRASANN